MVVAGVIAYREYKKRTTIFVILNAQCCSRSHREIVVLPLA